MDWESGARAPASGGVLEGEGTSLVRKKLRLMGEIEGTVHGDRRWRKASVNGDK